MYVWNCVHNGRRIPAVENAYLGLPHDESEIAGLLERRGVPSERFETDDLVQLVAGELATGKVVGWYQERSEWGPRALGNRSILAHPGWPGMKDLINAKIKRRESFRPFAPTILAERVSDYFEQDVASPFMMHVVKIREDRREELSAVTHADGSGRLHTVTATQNPLYYSLIYAFEKLTGTPVLLNTSFNENEPIVETAEQALDCFLRTDLDVLCLGRHIIRKPADQEMPASEASAVTRAS
jgi:carbamoyltransferase